MKDNLLLKWKLPTSQIHSILKYNLAVYLSGQTVYSLTSYSWFFFHMPVISTEYSDTASKVG